MPNGFYPVEGLDVIHLNRTEHFYPTFQWKQYHHTFEAVSLRHREGDVVFRDSTWNMLGYGGLQLMLRTIQKIFTDLGQLANISGSFGDGISIDFQKRRGIAFGSWFIYRITKQGAELLHGGGAPAHLAIERAEQLKSLPAVKYPYQSYQF